MLETVNLDRSLKASEYKPRKKELQQEMYSLQRYLQGEKLPLLVVLEGLETAGKGSVIEKLVEPLDPRGFQVFPFFEATEDEKQYPFLYRYWKCHPPAGRIHVFDRSYYMHVLDERVKKKVSMAEVQAALDEIKAYERTLVDNGLHLVKIWLHISKKEQKKRLGKLQKSVEDSWRVTKETLEAHKQYDKYIVAAEEMMARTSTAWAPWNIIASENLRYSRIQVMKTIVDKIQLLIGKSFREKAIEAFEKDLEQRKKAEKAAEADNA